MKAMLFLMTLLLSVVAYASDANFSEFESTAGEKSLYLPADDSIEANFTQLRGRVLYGRFVNCEIYNHTYRPIRISHYKYVIEYRDKYGYIKTSVERPNCYHNCFVHSGHYLRLSGPRNAPNVIRAQCKAFGR